MNIQVALQQIAEEKAELEAYGNKLDKWDRVDPSSEFALPQCGHIRGMYWDETKSAWCCKVCRKPAE